jgi:DNA-binding NtrC family response regulator
MQPTKQRILCIDNNASSNPAVYLLERVGYEVKMASSIAGAEKLAQVERFDLRLINHRLIDGLEIDSCERLDKFSPRIPILFYSTVAYPYEPIESIHCRQHGHSLAPLYVYDIVGHVSSLLQKQKSSVDRLRRQGTKTRAAVGA